MACCTHGVLSGPAYERIEKEKLDELVISDTIPYTKDAKKLTVLTASTMIGERLLEESIITNLLILFLMLNIKIRKNMI